MKNVAKFEKVSYQEFKKACESCMSPFDVGEEEIKAMYDQIRLPSRATKGSAGYDFYLPMNIHVGGIYGKSGRLVPTGIRCKIKSGWMLMCCPKSGLGFKYHMQLANTVGIIDSDYYFSDNEGHIMAKMLSEQEFNLNAGDKFMQGIFIPYGIVKGDSASGIRNGGFGSTGR